MGANKILPIAASLVVVMVIVIGVISWKKEVNSDATLESIPTVDNPDVDTSADTLRSLTAEIGLMKKNSRTLSDQNERLLNQKNAIAQELEGKLRDQFNKTSSSEKNHLNTVVGELSKQLDFFKSRMDDLSATQDQFTASDIPIGFGLDGAGGANMTPQAVRIWPLGTQLDKNSKPINLAQNYSSDSLLHPRNESSLDVERILASTKKTKDLLLPETEKPVYTVPRSATLIGSTGMTALIGRIPLNNVVQEPFPFKVIVGKDNLAANGIEMPFLDGMIFSGKATGDWTLSCVRGTVHTVTFLFTDGTIRTLSSDEKNNIDRQSSSRSQVSQSNRPLGWISDKRGIPCVAGRRISNASDFLAGRILASAASAAAAAFAQNEVTTTVSPSQGTSTSFITGDAVKNAGYNGLSGGADEVADYIRERAAQSFDVIYVDTGKELAIHVDVELPIDYEINGRKTNYAEQTHTSEYLD